MRSIAFVLSFLLCGSTAFAQSEGVPASSHQNFYGQLAQSRGNQQIFNVQDFGAIGGNVSLDQPAIQNAINAALVHGGVVRVPPGAGGACYQVTGLVADLSTITTFSGHRFSMIGDNRDTTCIQNTNGANPAFTYKGAGATAGAITHFALENMRFVGNNSIVSNSAGIRFYNEVALAVLDNIQINNFDTGLWATDTEQLGIYNSVISNNHQGILASASACCTSTNSWTIVNTALTSNSVYGAQFNNVNALAWFGGSIQYNGTIGGGSTQFGIELVDTGNGYGNVLFSGMIFEGNGGLADFVSQQNSSGLRVNVTFDTVSFTRTTAGYATNAIYIGGTAKPNSNYKIVNSTFISGPGYTPSAGRPLISWNNTSAYLDIDRLSYFQNSTEAPAAPTGSAGCSISATSNNNSGGITSSGVTSCTITFSATYHYVATPACVASDWTRASALQVNSSTTNMVVSGLTSGDTFFYLCQPLQGG